MGEEGRRKKEEGRGRSTVVGKKNRISKLGMNEASPIRLLLFCFGE